MPTQTAAMWSRPRSSTRIAIRNPSPFLAEPVGGRHRRFVEIDVADMGALLAHLLLGLADETPGQVGRDEEGGDALRARLAGARHDGEQRRLVGIGDEALGAVQPVDVAVAHRPGLDRGAVGAGARLGQREAGDDLARGDARAATRPSGPRCRPSPGPGCRCRHWCRRWSGRPGVVPPSSSATRTSSAMVRPRPPYSSGMDRPNRPMLAHLGDDLGRAPRPRGRPAPRAGAAARATKRRTVSRSGRRIRGRGACSGSSIHVIPAKAGVQRCISGLDSRFRGMTGPLPGAEPSQYPFIRASLSAW